MKSAARAGWVGGSTISAVSVNLKSARTSRCGCIRQNNSACAAGCRNACKLNIERLNADEVQPDDLDRNDAVSADRAAGRGDCAGAVCRVKRALPGSGRDVQIGKRNRAGVGLQ